MAQYVDGARLLRTKLGQGWRYKLRQAQFILAQYEVTSQVFSFCYFNASNEYDFYTR